MQILIYPAAFFFVLSVLVLVHEFGHFAVAKLCGVRVETFSLGFGKRIFGFRRGDTDYRVSILPLGGYVKMAGDNPMETHTGDPGEFMSHPRWQRFLIAVAGPVMNVVLAIVVLTGVFMFHDEGPVYFRQQPVVGWVDPDSPASDAGIVPGDKIQEFAGVQNPTWEQVNNATLLSPGQPVNVVIQRGGETLNKTLVPEKSKDEVGTVGWTPETKIAVMRVQPGSPADKAGLQVDDQIVSLDDFQVKCAPCATNWLRQNGSKPVNLVLNREGRQFSYSISPQLDPTDNHYRLGVFLGEALEVNRLPVDQAFNKALKVSRANSSLIFELVGKLFQRKISIKVLESPVGIMRDSGRAAKAGWPTLMLLMGLLSLQLAIFNAFPIPILDGGLMLMLLIEAIMRRDIKQEIKERVYVAAFVALVLFFAVVVFNDVAKTLH